MKYSLNMSHIQHLKSVSLSKVNCNDVLLDYIVVKTGCAI